MEHRTLTLAQLITFVGRKPGCVASFYVIPIPEVRPSGQELNPSPLGKYVQQLRALFIGIILMQRGPTKKKVTPNEPALAVMALHVTSGHCLRAQAMYSYHHHCIK